MTWAKAIVAVLVVGAMLAGCTSTGTPATNTSSGGSSGGVAGGQCNEPCVLFNVQFNLTGLDSVQGSFVDRSSGSGYSSCSDFAKGDSVGFVLGPGTLGSNVAIGGKSVGFGFTVSKDKFHGPGTYSDVLAGGGLTIGPDTFFGNSSSETLNADGSGSGTFANLQGGSVTGAQGTESGTVTWTCTK